MFNILQRARDSFLGAVSLLKAAASRTSNKEKGLTVDLLQVKRKLGKSFFTRSLTPASRRRREKSLNLEERQVATNMGWIPCKKGK